jgi:hypothetical protein
MARELTLPRATAFEPTDGSFRVEAAGRLDTALEEFEEAWSGAFQIGSDAAVECLFFKETNDAAASLVSLSQSYFEQLASERDLAERRLMSIGADSVGPTPYLAIDWLAAIDDAAYQVKLKYANKGERGISCLHAETGYARTFDAFFRGLVASYSGAAEAAVDFRDVTLVSIGEITVGYQTTEITEEADGDFAIVLIAASLVPTGPTSVSSSDDSLWEWSRPDGTLINQLVVSSDGMTLTRLSLEPVDGVWQVRGEMQGKPIDASFDTPSPLFSSRGEYQLMRQVAAGEVGGEVSYQRWLGPVNPTVATRHIARAGGAARVEVTAGPLTITAEVDDRGVSSSRLEMGRVRMSLERVYVEGHP